VNGRTVGQAVRHYGGGSGAARVTREPISTPLPLPQIDWIQRPEPVIAGTWNLRLELVEQGEGRVVPPEANGQLQLECQGPGLNETGRPCPDTYQGTYDASLALLFGPPLELPLTGVTTPQGMVELASNPGQDHGSYILRGMMRHDSIIGEWVVTSYGTGSIGRFVMTRKE
jgi:hypothetical protein